MVRYGVSARGVPVENDPDYVIPIRFHGKTDNGHRAFRGAEGPNYGFYYIHAPDPKAEHGMSYYRCSKDWEPQWVVNNKFKVIK